MQRFLFLSVILTLFKKYEINCRVDVKTWLFMPIDIWFTTPYVILGCTDWQNPIKYDALDYDNLTTSWLPSWIRLVWIWLSRLLLKSLLWLIREKTWWMAFFTHRKWLRVLLQFLSWVRMVFWWRGAGWDAAMASHETGGMDPSASVEMMSAAVMQEKENAQWTLFMVLAWPPGR